jgi:hypothetical protein
MFSLLLIWNGTLRASMTNTMLMTWTSLRMIFKILIITAANVNRLNQVVATDTYFSDTPALDDGIMGHGGTKMVLWLFQPPHCRLPYAP